ncbi:MAG TPA: META domain-containing protein [Cryomorphaceae bacterium]|nr:META domain-containing protein [Cryomorphaceae bacterium]
MKPLFAALLLLLGISAGCPNHTDTTPSIVDTKWLFSLPPDVADEYSSPTGELIHFRIQANDSAVAGYTGCNHFMGTSTLGENSAIAFSKMASTRMACLDAAVSEYRFLQIFENAAQFSLSGDTLTLRDEAGNELGDFHRETVR